MSASPGVAESGGRSMPAGAHRSSGAIPAAARSPVLWLAVALVLRLAHRGHPSLHLVGLIPAITRRSQTTATRRRTRRRHSFVWLVSVLMYMGVVPINGAFRHRSPIEPFFIMLAAYAVVRATERSGKPRAGSLTFADR